VVGHIEENKGLKDIKVGQRAMFEADAFGSKQFNGVVDEISETSRQSDVVFNISDNRQVQIFDVKIRYNLADYPELKNGMSAKVWIYK
jgi:ketol-acid reductoisomerase